MQTVLNRPVVDVKHIQKVTIIDLKENQTEHGRQFDGKQVLTSGRGKKECTLLQSGL